ncbi:hypothetical protein NPX13_g2824 [Xylaria arbuscula]|uniref:NAD(P)H-hydrate epimerase n=1 Tax=Xylaria arbuscula TaxID=114810 RepID=A0A9W8NIG2_9PEZI|nr:hypothetical protein NPX13_g2824 [Xylaria arbuscula]
MAFKTLSAKAAAALDQELMSTGAFSIDQLMELAGLSVSQFIMYIHSKEAEESLLPADPGTTVGGDGLVAARHLRHYPRTSSATQAVVSRFHNLIDPKCDSGYQPSVYYPKRSKNDLYQRLAKQLEDLEVEFVDDFTSAMKLTDHVVDAVFGFSFSGEVREPFPAVIQALEETKLPVTSVDAPSSWDIENGPPKSGLGSHFNPAYLISLTAPKPLVQHFKGRHFIGGRFVTPGIAKKYDFEVPSYQGIDQFVEVGAESGRKL